MTRKTFLLAFTVALVLVVHAPQILSAPVPKAKDGYIAFWGDGKPMLLSPDGAVCRDLSHKDYPGGGHAAVSPDGRRVALLARQPDVKLTPEVSVWIYKLYIRGVDEKGSGVELRAADLTFGDELRWSPDGQRLYVETGTLLPDMRKAVARGESPDLRSSRLVVFDVARKTRACVPRPAGHNSFLGERPDGQLLTGAYTPQRVTARMRGVLDSFNRFALRAFWMTPDGGGSARLPVEYLDSIRCPSHLSTDGKRLLAVGSPVDWESDGLTADEIAKHRDLLRVVDLETGKRFDLKIAGLPEEVAIRCIRWSPDGKRIAFSFSTRADDSEWSDEASLCVCNADGRNMKVIRKGTVGQFANFEWR